MGPSGRLPGPLFGLSSSKGQKCQSGAKSERLTGPGQRGAKACRRQSRTLSVVRKRLTSLLPFVRARLAWDPHYSTAPQKILVVMLQCCKLSLLISLFPQHSCDLGNPDLISLLGECA